MTVESQYVVRDSFKKNATDLVLAFSEKIVIQVLRVLIRSTLL